MIRTEPWTRHKAVGSPTHCDGGIKRRIFGADIDALECLPSQRYNARSDYILCNCPCRPCAKLRRLGAD